MLLRLDHAVACEAFLVRPSQQQLLDMFAVNPDHFMLGGGRNLWFRVYISHSDLPFCSVCFAFLFCLPPVHLQHESQIPRHQPTSSRCWQCALKWKSKRKKTKPTRAVRLNNVPTAVPLCCPRRTILLFCPKSSAAPSVSPVQTTPPTW